MFVISGVTGHVGGVVARELLGRGEKVKALIRDPSKGGDWSRLGAEIAVGALDDVRFLTGALRGATGFFVLLPPNYQVSGFYAHQRKVGDAVAAAVKESGVPHVVQLSSVGADLAVGNGPIKGLHHLENALRATGATLTAVRAGSFMENVGNSLAAARGQGVFPNMMASSDTPTPMIATRDVGFLAAHELAMPSPRSEIIDLLGPAYSAKDVAKTLGNVLGKALQVVDIAPESQVGALLKAGMSQELAESMAEMNAGFASGRLKPVGDRMKRGRTGLESVIRGLV
jgi:uncharacterized protein YbjT (DUF2867 family)